MILKDLTGPKPTIEVEHVSILPEGAVYRCCGFCEDRKERELEEDDENIDDVQQPTAKKTAGTKRISDRRTEDTLEEELTKMVLREIDSMWAEGMAGWGGLMAGKDAIVELVKVNKVVDQLKRADDSLTDAELTIRLLPMVPLADVRKRLIAEAKLVVKTFDEDWEKSIDGRKAEKAKKTKEKAAKLKADRKKWDKDHPGEPYPPELAKKTKVS
jgi:hypothetical protein